MGGQHRGEDGQGCGRVELRIKQEAEEPFLYPRLQIVKAKEEAKPIYKMAQELFRKDQS